MNFLDDTALAKAEAMLREWAEYVSLGRGGSVPTSRERENARRAPSSAPDPVWITCQVEQFFEEGRNMQFRAYALAAYWHGTDLSTWVWRAPWDPPYRACLRMGWGWVEDKLNPIPEVAAAFVDAFLAWSIENPITATIAPLPEVIGDVALPGDDPYWRLVSIRVACILLEHHAANGGEPREYPASTLRRWCARGVFKGASKMIGADWVIPYGSLRDFAAPKRGRKAKKEKSEHKNAA